MEGRIGAAREREADKRASARAAAGGARRRTTRERAQAAAASRGGVAVVVVRARRRRCLASGVYGTAGADLLTVPPQASRSGAATRRLRRDSPAEDDRLASS